MASPERSRPNAYSEMWERFERDTSEHEMHVLRDDGLYRHLRFIRPEGDAWRSAYYYDLITWPGYLAVVGDCGDFMFSRVRDMFEFFEQSSGINPDYWSEKLRGPGRHDDASRTFSADRYRQRVLDWQREAEEDLLPPATFDGAVERDGTGAARDVLAYLDDIEADYTEQDIERLLGFRDEVHWQLLADVPFSEHAAIQRLDEFVFEHTRYGRTERLHIYEPYDWNMREWDHQYLWCCCAIVAGIQRYRAATPQAVAA